MVFVNSLKFNHKNFNKEISLELMWRKDAFVALQENPSQPDCPLLQSIPSSSILVVNQNEELSKLWRQHS